MLQIKYESESVRGNVPKNFLLIQISEVQMYGTQF